MRPVPLDGSFDAAAAASPDIDRFCSSSWWGLSVRAGFAPEAPLAVRRGQEGWAALVELTGPDGLRFRTGLDVMWGMGCPIVGPNPRELALAFMTTMEDEHDEWDAIFVPGVAVGSTLHETLTAWPDVAIGRGRPAVRRVASLEGGVDGFLARRSSKLRATLRRAQRQARQTGMTVTEQRDHGSFERALAVERRSWKGARHDGLLSPNMQTCYREMTARLAGHGALRAMFASIDGVDVGYVLGGVSGEVYRGLQFSYDAGFADLSVGNLLQLYQIERLVEEGVATYDLGMDIAYKRRWSDRDVTTLTVALVRRHPAVMAAVFG